MIKILLGIVLLFLSTNLYAVRPTIFGVAEFNDEAFRDTAFNYIKARKDLALPRERKLVKFEILTASVTVYGLTLWAHFNNSLLDKRDEIKNKILDVKGNVKTIRLEIAIWIARNDTNVIPGTCIPDTIDEWILK